MRALFILCGMIVIERIHGVNPLFAVNLWPLLPQILKVLPMVSRNWLYFGEGEMLQSDVQTSLGPAQAAPSPEMLSELARLRAELDEANRLNRQLVTRLLVDGVGDKDASKNMAGKAADGQ